MGGGKGSKFSKLVYPVYPGCIILELRGISNDLIFEVMNYAAKKLPFKTKSVFLDLV
jgi:ribosomal protein L16/L10AE